MLAISFVMTLTLLELISARNSHIYETSQPYRFGYRIDDGHGNTQHRNEVRDIRGVVRGSYGYRDANGVYRTVRYVADEYGTRMHVTTNEPGTSTDSHPVRRYPQTKRRRILKKVTTKRRRRMHRIRFEGPTRAAKKTLRKFRSNKRTQRTTSPVAPTGFGHLRIY
ncbi:Uncharacterised protein g21 [Pycnogonum litorale]